MKRIIILVLIIILLVILATILILNSNKSNIIVEENNKIELISGDTSNTISKEITEETTDEIEKENAKDDSDESIIFSDTYYFDDFREIPKKEITPSKIYLMDDSSSTIELEHYGEKIELNIPIEKCKTEDEERIEYSKYGIVKYLKTGKVIIKNLVVDSIEENEYDNDLKKDIVLYYQFLDCCQIYEVELDDDNNTKELFVYKALPYPAEYECPYVIKIENDNATNAGLINGWNIRQVGDNKNIFTDGFDSDIEDYFSNILMGYYIYDKDKGLIDYKKMANGEDIKDIDIQKLDNCILERDTIFSKGINSFKETEMYIYNNSLNPVNDDDIVLKKGTRIKIVEILDAYYGCFIGEAEDGTQYGFIQSAGRT